MEKRSTMTMMKMASAVMAAALIATPANAADIGAFLFKRGAEKNIGSDLAASLPDGLHIGVCGSGSPMPDPARQGPCAFAIAGAHLFIFDMGPGASRNLSPMGVRAVAT